jgi:hypothetical protein
MHEFMASGIDAAIPTPAVAKAEFLINVLLLVIVFKEVGSPKTEVRRKKIEDRNQKSYVII